MKKNITINLCGRLFAIDEDAYQMLSTYLESLRKYFRQHEGDEEIADDIEARIAELFAELKQQGAEAINIEHVREVIQRIGRPEEMEGEAPSKSPQGGTCVSDESPEDMSASPRGGREGASPKRLYRNPTDKKMMGVLSGFAAYFGGDVLWWRLGYAAVVLLSFAASIYNFIALIVAYILLAILMPVAETPEDLLRMKGKEVNPQNLAEEVANSRPTYSQPTPAPSPGRGDQTGSGQAVRNTPPQGGAGGGQPQSSHRGLSGCIGCIGGFFTALWTVFTTLFRWTIYAFGGFVAGMSLAGIITLLAIALNTEGWFEKSGGIWVSPEFAAVVPDLKVPFCIFVVAALLVLAITAYAIIHSLLNEFRQMPSMPYRQRIALLVTWILGLVACGAAIGYGLPKFIDADEKYNKRHWKEIDTELRQHNTHDGIYVQPHEWKFLQEGGWHIINAEGCNDRFTAKGEYMTGDRDVRYIDCYDEHHRQRLRIERTDSLQPGTYRLTCVARANGNGACFYAIVGNQEPQFVEIPATGNEGGEVWEDAETERYLTLMRERQRAAQRGEEDFADENVKIPENIQQIRQANHGKGFGWNELTITPIRITQPTILRYGVSSDPTFTGRTWLGQYFSATDFKVSRVEDIGS